MPNLTSIGWWASAADIYNTTPSRTINLGGVPPRYVNFMVAPSDFVGYTGNWYLLGANGMAYSPIGCSGSASPLFTVVDPSLDIRIRDFNKNADVTGKSVPLGERLGFRIDTNMYPATDRAYRTNLIDTCPKPNSTWWANYSVNVTDCISCNTFHNEYHFAHMYGSRWIGWATWTTIANQGCYSQIATLWYDPATGLYYNDSVFTTQVTSPDGLWKKNPSCGSPNLDPSIDGYIDIKIKNKANVLINALYNASLADRKIAGKHSLLKNYVNKQPFFWGSPGTYSWNTSALNKSTSMYPAGTYTVWAESALNHMKDNYKNGGADYTGKTVSQVYTITLFARPTVTSVSPVRGPTTGGTRVTVTGTGFTGATAVRFGSTAGTSLIVNSSTKITIISPAHGTGIVDVTVITPGGTSAIVAGDRFTYGAPPKVTSISPTKGSAAGNTLVTVTGTGFTGATAVRFGTPSGTSKTVVSSTKITVRSPAHAEGVVDVRVTTPYGTSAIIAGDKFTYT